MCFILGALETYRQAHCQLPGVRVWQGPLFAMLVDVRQLGLADQPRVLVRDQRHFFPGEETRGVQALRRQGHGVRDVLALLALLEAVGVPHHVGELGPHGLVGHVRGEEIHGVQLAELVVLDAVAARGTVLGDQRGVGGDEGAKAGVFREDGGSALGGCFDEVGEAAGDVDDGGEVPFGGWVLSCC